MIIIIEGLFYFLEHDPPAGDGILRVFVHNFAGGSEAGESLVHIDEAGDVVIL